MAIGWKGETRGRRVDKGVKGLLSHSIGILNARGVACSFFPLYCRTLAGDP